jgi:hypothetical protein
MRILATLVLLLSNGMLVSTTLAANAPDRPPGVDAEHWVVLGESIGIVLTTGEESTPAGKVNSWKLPVSPDALIAPTSPFVSDGTGPCGQGEESVAVGQMQTLTPQPR